MRCYATVFALTLAIFPMPVAAKESLGIYDSWGAFRDQDVSHCYAIAESEEITGKAERKSYISVGYWPNRNIRAQIHVRLSRDRSTNSRSEERRVGNECRYLLSGSPVYQMTIRRKLRQGAHV